VRNALFLLSGYWVHLKWDALQRNVMYAKGIQMDGCNFVHTVLKYVSTGH